MEKTIEKTGRVKWIDCAKAIAIMAVVIDHCNGILYSNQVIANASYFSVSLFILLSGLSTYISGKNKRVNTIGQQIKKVGSFFAEYAIATLIIYVVNFKSFDLQTYISYLLNFSISGQFYFLVFFFQLMLISPLLLSWCKFCENKKYRYVWHIATTLAMAWAASIFIRYTYILPLHGGGKYLFGGTYLLIYYIGILLGNFNVFNNKRLVFTFGISAILWIGWLYMSYSGVLPFDVYLQPYWGDGFNPPSIKFMVFALITAFLCYSVFSWLENFGKIATHVVDVFCVLGQYTLYTFFYHLLVRDLLMKCFPNMISYNVLIRILFFIIIVVLPVLIVMLAKKLNHNYWNRINELER